MPSDHLDPVDVVGLGHVLTHAQQIGLPIPFQATLGPDVASLGGPAVRLDLKSIVDLTEWARYLEKSIETEALTPNVDLHSVEGEVLELPVRLICTIAYDPSVLASIRSASTTGSWL
ncbi:hypothetical protein GCM10023340_38610 [Nocardioides marinquilinus]|uniref:Uncharacterized protein n=1 Tax=Nocardioides marinquilinus TaxID=1210400 RepID=A0ABP9Q0X3_9ACTN